MTERLNFESVLKSALSGSVFDQFSQSSVER